MSELWIPQPDKRPDITNIFDLMMVFQEKIDSVFDKERKFHEARIALKALTASLKHLNEDERQLTIVTGLAIIEPLEQEKTGTILEDVGLNGIIDDLHYVSIGSTLPPTLAIGLDTMTFFPADDPDDIGYAMSQSKAPISSVHFIETHAA